MSRTLSTGFRAALYAQETDEILVCLLTITHDDLAEPLRISTDATQRITSDPLVYGTVSNGNNFLFVPVDVVLPQDSSDSDPRAKLSIDNTDLALIASIRSISSRANVQIECVLASDPDTVEIDFPKMVIGSATYNRDAIEFDLTVDALFNEPYPGGSYLPSNFPGLF